MLGGRWRNHCRPQDQLVSLIWYCSIRLWTWYLCGAAPACRKDHRFAALLCNCRICAHNNLSRAVVFAHIYFRALWELQFGNKGFQTVRPLKWPLHVSIKGGRKFVKQALSFRKHSFMWHSYLYVKSGKYLVTLVWFQIFKPTHNSMKKKVHWAVTLLPIGHSKLS